MTKKEARTVHIREGGFGMKQITSYGFKRDTACVELKFSDETAVAIDTIAVSVIDFKTVASCHLRLEEELVRSCAVRRQI